MEHPDNLLQLTSLSLIQFKNYRKRSFDFEKRIISITGNNGVGKTNILDAIYYLCFAKSYFNVQESLNVLHGCEGFRLEGTFRKNGKTEVLHCVYKGGKKELVLDGEAYRRFSRHLGRFPAVIISPDDAVLIRGGSEQRRRFLDTLLSQLDGEYLDDLIVYQKILQQRNGLLRNTPSGRSPDRELLTVLDQQLCTHGNRISEKRKDFFPSVEGRVRDLYAEISGSGERIGIVYESTLLHTPMNLLLERNLRRDLQLQRTTDGIHHDDLVLLLDGYPARQTASQGQRKNFLFALKLAQYELLRFHKGFPPLLLLDDLFEKLDHGRVARLVRLICGPGFGQVFITDTEASRLKEAFADEIEQVQLISL